MIAIGAGEKLQRRQIGGKMKKRLFLLLCFMVFLFPTVSIDAAQEEEPAACGEVIEGIVAAMDARDWDAFLGYCVDDMRSEMESYFAKMTEDTVGINQVVGAELRSCYKLAFEDYRWLISYESYDVYEEVGDENISAYLLAVDYDVAFETLWFYQGLNYSLFIFIYDGTDYKLVQFTIPPYSIIEKYVCAQGVRSVLSEEEQKALAAAESRAHGTPVNLEGSVLPNERMWSGSEATQESEEKQAETRASQDTVPTNITVWWRTNEGGDGEIYTVNFRTYCQQVLANEWLASWNDMSLYAGAHCVKTFSWYYCLYPQGGVGGYNINSIQQSWSPTHVTYTATNDAILAHFRSAMFDASGNIFPAYYKKGKSGQAGTQGCGEVSQYGSHYLAGLGYSPTEILRYYYDGSDLAGGQIQFKTVNES